MQQDTAEEYWYKRIPIWVEIGAGLAVALLVFGWELKHPTISAGLIGLGSGLLVSMVLVIANVFIGNIWPNRREERDICALLWNENRRILIKGALKSEKPAEELSFLYTGDPMLSEFRSADIYRAVNNMHEGAFLAAIHLWGEDTYDEEIMAPDYESLDEEIEISVHHYRKLLAEKISRAHITAARRYRIKSSNFRSYVTSGNKHSESVRLRSLTNLVYNVAEDLSEGWVVDVEFYRDEGHHNPYLDYALLFGAQSQEIKENRASLPRIAYVTHSKERLKRDGDYTGVAVSDPEVVMALMRDRFRAVPGVKDGLRFIAEAIPYLHERLGERGTSPLVIPNCSDANDLQDVKKLLVEFATLFAHQVQKVSDDTSEQEKPPTSFVSNLEK